MPSVVSSRPPFLTLNPPPSPFNPPFDLSPLSSPKSAYSHDGSVSPLTPEPEPEAGSRFSGFPGFDFDLPSNAVTRPPPAAAQYGSTVVPPGGVYRQRSADESAPPPPYERYSRHAGLHATRTSVAAGQFPTDAPAPPAPAYARQHHPRFASVSSLGGPPRRSSGQRQLRSLTLSDIRTVGHAYPPQLPPPPKKKQASWRIFGARGSNDAEKRPFASRGRWIVYIAAATTLITLAIVTALVVTMRPPRTEPAGVSALDGFPPLPPGLAHIMPQGPPETPAAACVLPSSLWSCELPSDALFPKTPGGLPDFAFTIEARSTAAAVPGDVPGDAEYAALAQADGVRSQNKSGEKTPFSISLQTSSGSVPRRRRSTLQQPSQQLLPAVLQNQPLRLFDRGLDSEHYGFSTYYRKTTRADVQVSWEDTRFRVAIWTARARRRDGDGAFPYPVSVLVDRSGSRGRVWYAGDFGPRVGVDEVPGRGCVCEWRNWRAGVN